MAVTMKSNVLWNMLLFSPVEVQRYSGGSTASISGINKQAEQSQLIACLAYSSTLMIEAVHSSKMSVNLDYPITHLRR